MSTGEKFLQMFIALGLFAGVFGLALVVVDRVRGRSADRVAAIAFILPAVVMLAVGLIIPGVQTIVGSFRDGRGRGFVGFDNYQTMLTDPDQLIVLRNTAIWVILVPFVATIVGLVYAILVDRTRTEAFAKALVFLPMAISMVGASIIWKFVYDFRPEGAKQIGLANQLLVWIGIPPQQFLLTSPWNSLFLIVVMVWIQAGFAMTVLSAAIKAIPDDIIEAARLDGVGSLGMFRFVTVPSIRPALIVVLTTIAMGTLKAFDVVRTMTGGNFKTNIVALEFYKQSFVQDNKGYGSALAVLLFLLVTPIVLYNINQYRKADVR